MSSQVNLYGTAYRGQFDPLHREVREETYGIDLGQTGWMTAEELDKFLTWMALTPASELLEVGCGAGGCAVYISERSQARVTGIDLNEQGISSAKSLARAHDLHSRVQFQTIDASRNLPFENEVFDVIFSNDAICHIPNRSKVLQEWWRVLKPGGRILYTDALIVTGMLSNEELATRSSVGYYLFLPRGENERLIREAGFELLRSVDLTASVASVSKRWHDARAKRETMLIESEGKSTFDGLQKFLSCVLTVSEERRLSRYAYLGRKPLR